MPQRPIVVAFDVIETLFPLEPLRARITEAGQPACWSSGSPGCCATPSR
jgi:hypothetical protein